MKNFTSSPKTKVYMVTFMAILLNFGLSNFSFAQGPGSAWQYYRPITLSPATPGANFQVKVTLTAGQYTNMKSDGSDLRFYNGSDVNCEYWIETWNTSGTSTIWVKVPNSGATVLFLYYGNASATAASNGDNVFDFFDDFTSALGSEWTKSGNVTQSGTNVTLSNTNGTTAATLSNTSAFIPSLASFLIETKHYEVGYNRNRFYATTATNGGSPIAVGDYGYFSNNSGSQTSAQVFWGSFPGTTSVSNNTNYLTQWRITDGSTYNWYTYIYSTGAAVTNGSRTTTYASNIRYITISVTEVASTSTIVDWIRVRQYTATEPVGTVGSQYSTAATSSTFSSSGTFIVPPGVNSITVACWGGGGRGGSTSGDAYGAGGGGGAYSSSILSPVTPGNTYTVTVGAGSSSTAAGGDSWFGSTSTVLAKGGNSGPTAGGVQTGASGGAAASGVGTTKYSGGSGASGVNSGTDYGGGGGSSAGTGSNGTTATNQNGATAPSGGGNGGAGKYNTDGIGTAGTAPGGGGGGALRNGGTNYDGGTGANGQVTITWITCTNPSFTEQPSPSPQTLCQGGSATALTVTASPATGYQWYSNTIASNTGGTLISGATSTSYTPLTGTPGTLYYYCVVSNSTCNTTSNVSGAIIVNGTPTTANAGPDQTLCNVTTATLAGNTATVGTGAWSVVSGTATVTSPTSPTSGVTGLVVGASATLRWTITNSPCSASTDDVVITVSAPPTTAAAGSDQANCNSGSFTLAGNTPSIGTGLWSLVSGTATITAPTSPTSGVTGVPSGTSATLRWTISNAPCTASTDDVVLANNAAPNITGQPASPSAICAGTNSSNFTVTATGAGLSYQWERGISGTYTSITAGTTPNDGCTYSNYTTATLTVSNAPAGMNGYTYRCVVSGTCSPSANSDGSATLTVYPDISDNTIASNQAICSGTAPSGLTGSSPTGGTGSYGYQWQISTTSGTSGFSDIGGATSQNYAPGTLSVNTWYHRIVNSGGCSDVSASIEISVTNCSGSETFNSSTTWTVPSCVTQITVQAWGGGGAGGGSTNASTLQGRGGAGGGGGAYASSTITVTPGAVLNIAVASAVSGSSGATGANGGNSTITGFESSILAAGGSGGTGNTSGGSPAGGAGGTVAASAGTTRIAGANGGNGATGLGISSGAGGTGANSGGAGGASITSGSANGNVGTAPGGGGGGSRTSQTDGNRTGGTGGAGRIIITYTVVLPPTITLGTMPSVSQGTTTANLPYSATTGTPTLYAIDFDAAANSAGFADVAYSTLTASPIVITVPVAAPTATYNGTLKVKTAAGCESSGYAISVTVTASTCVNPTVPNLSATVNPVCYGGSTTLNIASGSLNSATAWQWYSGSCGGTSVGSGTSISVSPTATTTYYARGEGGCVTLGSCGSITVSVNTPSTDPSSASASVNPICGGATVLTLSGGSAGTGAVIHWYSGSCGGTPVGTGNGLSVSPGVTTTYYGRYEDPAPCSHNSACASVTVTVNTQSTNPSSASASVNPTCGGATFLTLTGGGGGTGTIIHWYTSSDNTCSGTLTLVGAGNSLSVSPSGTTTYLGRYEDPAPCSHNTACASVTVTVNTQSTDPASASASVNPTCGGATLLTLSGGSAGTGAVIHWYTSSDNTCGGTLTSIGTGNSLSVSPSGTTTYLGRYEDPAPCSHNTACASVTVTVNTINTAGAPTSTPTLCVNSLLSPDITHSTTGATGISNDGVSGANGLPAGVAAHWAADVITISGTPTASGTFNYSILLTGGCGSVNATGTITVNSAGTWIGGGIGNWATGANWCGGSAPGTGASVSIPNQPIDPVISPTTMVTVNNLTMEAGATLTIESNATNSGSLIVNGTVSGGGESNISYKRQFKTYPVTGFDWHYFSSPVEFNTAANADKVTQVWGWNEETGATGAWYSTTILGLQKGVGYNLDQTPDKDGLLTFTGSIVPLSFTVYATSPYLNEFDGSDYSTRAFAPSRDGTTGYGGGGWNLLGNPFTSAMNVSKFILANYSSTPALSNFDPNYVALYVYDGSQSPNGIYSIIGINDEGIIPVGQGFFVLAMKNYVQFNFISGNGTSGMQIANTDELLKSAQTTLPGVQLKVKYGADESSTKVVYADQMTTGLDPGYDIGQLSAGPDVEIYTSLVKNDNGVNFARQALPLAGAEKIIVPVGVDCAKGATVTFLAVTVPIGNGSFYLIDKVTGTTTDLSKDSYTVTLPAKTAGTGRFYLQASLTTGLLNPPLRGGQGGALRIWTNQNTLNIEGSVSGNATGAVYDMLGRKIFESRLENSNLNTLAIPETVKGVYLIKVTDGERVATQKVVF